MRPPHLDRFVNFSYPPAHSASFCRCDGCASARLLPSSKSKEKEKELLPGPSEIYATSVFGAGGAVDQEGERAAPLVVGERRSCQDKVPSPCCFHFCGFSFWFYFRASLIGSWIFFGVTPRRKNIIRFVLSSAIPKPFVLCLPFLSFLCPSVASATLLTVRTASPGRRASLLFPNRVGNRRPTYQPQQGWR